MKLNKSVNEAVGDMKHADMDNFFNENISQFIVNEINNISDLDKAHMELRAKFGDEAVEYAKSIDASAETIKKMIKRGIIY